MHMKMSAVEPLALSSAGGTGRLWSRPTSNIVRVWVYIEVFFNPRDVPFRFGFHVRIGKTRPSFHGRLLHVEKLFRIFHRNVNEPASSEKTVVTLDTKALV